MDPVWRTSATQHSHLESHCSCAPSRDLCHSNPRRSKTSCVGTWRPGRSCPRARAAAPDAAAPHQRKQSPQTVLAMKSALGFGSLRMHKGAKLGGAPGSGKDSAPSSPLSPVVQAPTGPRPAVDPPAKRHKIDAASIGVFEEASPEVQQWCAATQRADLHALAHLIEKGMSADCEIDTLHHTALMFAAQEGRDDMIRLLLNNKANLKTVDGKGKNALIWAAIGGKLSTVTLLLDRGANVDVEDQDGLTPLMHASCFGSTPGGPLKRPSVHPHQPLQVFGSSARGSQRSPGLRQVAAPPLPAVGARELGGRSWMDGAHRGVQQRAPPHRQLPPREGSEA
ncbi:ankyrin repeat-containing domain protein [Hyaloraphidium curvatum]|nr:ankyrin repeat-containing domain protein [Hyaloraphidium curvatum]